MKVAIYSRGLEDYQQTSLLILLNELRKYNIEIIISRSLADKYPDITDNNKGAGVFNNTHDLDESVDCLISLGGDGTILDTVTLVCDKNIPILGINFGRLGFLASIGKEEITTAVDALVNGTYVVDKRTLIHLDADIPLFGDTPFALNEFALHKRDTSPMIKI